MPSEALDLHRTRVLTVLVRAPLLGAVLAGLTSCSTTVVWMRGGSLVERMEPQLLFEGTRTDLHVVGSAPRMARAAVDEFEHDPGLMFVFWVPPAMGLIDLPLSLAADLLLSPFALAHDLRVPARPSERVKEQQREQPGPDRAQPASAASARLAPK